MFRYSYYMTIEELIDLYPKGAAGVFSWQALLPLLPWSYYNYELVLGHGIEFIALYVASVAVLLWFAVVRGNPEALFVVSALIFFSVYSAITLKYREADIISFLCSMPPSGRHHVCVALEMAEAVPTSCCLGGLPRSRDQYRAFGSFL